MSFGDFTLLSITLVRRRIGIEPENDNRLIGYIFNVLIYLVLILSALWIFMGAQDSHGCLSPMRIWKS